MIIIERSTDSCYPWSEPPGPPDCQLKLGAGSSAPVNSASGRQSQNNLAGRPH